MSKASGVTREESVDARVSDTSVSEFTPAESSFIESNVAFLRARRVTCKALRRWGANESEVALARLIAQRGKSEIVRHGWPDFLLRRRRDNRLFGVEVKTGCDVIRPSQAACFAALEAGGIPVFVWNPSRPSKFVPWRVYREDARPRSGRHRKRRR